MPKIIVNPPDISLPAPGKVAFHNPVLRNLLVQKPQGALDWLSSRVSPVDISKISIDHDGRVVIDDPAFAKKIASRLAQGHEDAKELDNTACSNGSC